MRRGISPIIGVVLLIAIAVIGSVTAWYWIGSLSARPAVPVIPASLAAGSAGDSNIVIANLGGRTINTSQLVFSSTGTSFLLCQNETLKPNTQTICTPYNPPSNQITIFGKDVSPTSISIEKPKYAWTLIFDITNDSGYTDQSYIELHAGGLLLPDGYLLLGHAGSKYQTDEQPFLLKMSKDGGIIWVKEFVNTSGYTRVFDLLPISNTTIIILGRTSISPGGAAAYIASLSTNGTINWEESIKIDGTAWDTFYRAVYYNGSIYVVGNTGEGYLQGSGGIILAKIDAITGGIGWIKLYNTTNLQWAWSIARDGNNLIISGYDNNSGTMDPLIIKTDLDGIIENITVLQGGGNEEAKFGVVFDDGYLIIGTNKSSGTVLIVKLNKDLGLLDMKGLTGINYVTEEHPKIYDNQIVFCAHRTTPDTDSILIALNKSGGLERAILFNFSGINNGWASTIIVDNGILVGENNGYLGRVGGALYKFDDNLGIPKCPYCVNYSLTPVSQSFTPSPLSLTVSSPTYTITPISRIVVEPQYEVEILCPKK